MFNVVYRLCIISSFVSVFEFFACWVNHLSGLFEINMLVAFFLLWYAFLVVVLFVMVLIVNVVE